MARMTAHANCGVAGENQSRNSRAKGEKGETNLDADGDAVRARVVATLGVIVDDGTEHDTDRNAELVAGDDGATNLRR